MSFDVRLPKVERPVFPQRCIDCGCHTPETTIRFNTQSIGWWNYAFLNFGSPFSADVPVCISCRSRVNRQRWIRKTATYGLCLVAVLAAGGLLSSFQSMWKHWIVMLIALVSLLPLVFWEIAYPPLFDMTAQSDYVDYEFRDANYAEAFATLNASSRKVEPFE